MPACDYYWQSPPACTPPLFSPPQATLVAPAALTIRGVFQTLHQIAAEHGAGAAGRRQRAVLALLRACREQETRYLVRTLVQVR